MPSEIGCMPTTLVDFRVSKAEDKSWKINTNITKTDGIYYRAAGNAKKVLCGSISME